MTTHLLLPLRLRPGDELRPAIEAAVYASGHGAAFVVSGIGSLDRLRLRLAGAETLLNRDADFEMLSLAGSIAANGSHLHISVSDAAGQVLGGHVAPGCRVRTTAEILLALLPGHQLSREPDPATGYAELMIRPA
ncbi:PPC domain-containing DNA-binding protein [Roseateles violae]|uniref:DNA-binding protein n=1 Tax=Roseateles violae TaxID=3058042 RepID=A0ABT8DS90_9BURK|nr:PPC domain-containing DNA-binding protein [Pelomonas sp. PFR6]MDN3919933.1 DNA-binding protein [Pelomonas sp. PFR6]